MPGFVPRLDERQRKKVQAAVAGPERWALRAPKKESGPVLGRPMWSFGLLCWSHPRWPRLKAE
eukprot:7250052-Pyramimonas_sp.AAC.1